MAGPSLTSQLRTGLRYFYGESKLVGFAGGLNLRDAPTELAANESPNLWNVTLDERGGVVKRLGLAKWNASAAANLITYGYSSKVTGKILWYSQADGKLYSDPATGTLTLRRTWTSGYSIQIVDFAGSVYAIHPIDGLYVSTDGVTWTAVVAATGSAPVGSLICVWQNKLFCAGDPAHTLRITWCAPGDSTKWAGADGGGTNDIREKDDTAIVALLGGSGFDFQTKPSLLVFKARSFYRVTDSTTGAYVTIDAAAGCAGPNCLATYLGKVYFLSTAGVFETTGMSEAVLISGKLQPMFSPSALDYSKASSFCAGAAGDRIVFSVTRQGASANDLKLELVVPFLAFSAGSDAMGCYVTYRTNAETLIGASPTSAGQLYTVGSGGSDDGTAITSWFETHTFEPHGGHQARVQQIAVQGRGTFTIKTMMDYTTSGGTAATIAITNSGFTWGVGLWGTGVWGGQSAENYALTQPRTVGRTVRYRVDETSSLTTNAPKQLDSGPAVTVGAWALYGIDTRYAPLGIG